MFKLNFPALFKKTSNVQNILLLRNVAQKLINPNRNISCLDDRAKCPKAKNVTSPCTDNRHQWPPRKPIKKAEFVSMWESRKCDPATATCPAVRFDTLYYKPSDKAKRKYQQTWIECPAKLIRPTVICNYPKTKYPPLERRSRAQRPDTAKCMGNNLNLLPCSKQKDLKQNKNCLKIMLPGCRGVRADCRCKLFREKTICPPKPCPYPSFSECTHLKPRRKRASECECLKIRTMCEVWTVLREKTIL